MQHTVFVKRTVLAVSLAFTAGSAIAADSGFSGSIGAGFTAESYRSDSAANAAEMEYDLLKAKFTHSALENWTFNARIGREVAYEGNLSSGKKADNESGHSNNTYNVGAHYQINDSWGIKLGYEYENQTIYDKDANKVRHEVAEGISEYQVAADFNTALTDTTGFYAVLGIVNQQIQGENLDGSGMDSNWYYGVAGTSTDISDRTSVGFNAYYDRELGVDDNNYEYTEWSFGPSVSTSLDNGMGVAVGIFAAGEDGESKASGNYEDRFYGVTADLSIPVSARLDVNTGVAYERHIRENKGDYYEPGFNASVSYKF